MLQNKKRDISNWGLQHHTLRHTTEREKRKWGGDCSALKVPRQCPLGEVGLGRN
jgi:hypothetical protein